MTDADVRDALDRATRHLTPRPDLLDDVRRGGRARVVRRRGVLGAGVAVLAAGAAGGVGWPAGRRGPAPTDPFDRPTAGDLAGDRAHLRRVLAAWAAHVPADAAGQDPHGATHVLWTGTTPVGPAAFVAQRQRRRSPDVLVVGLVTTAGAGLAVEHRSLWSPVQGVARSHAYLIGAERDVLLIRDGGVPLRYSTAFRFRDDGRLDRGYRPVPFTDGAAVLPVPPQRERVTVGLLVDAAVGTEAVVIDNIFDIMTRSGHRVSDVFTHQATLAGAGAAWPPAALAGSDDEELAWAGGVLAPYLDPGGYPPFSLSPNLRLRTATPDGRRLLVRTEAVTDGTARVIVVWGRPQGPPVLRYVGVRDVSGPLELSLRLPDRQGVLVAMPNASLRYRTAGRPWLPAGEDYALLPDAAVEVEVTARGGRPARVSVR